MSHDPFATRFDGQDPFAPEIVDEQITARIAGRAPADRETHITQGLATLNRLPPGADDSLARVRMRLRAAPFPIQTSMPTVEVNRPMNDLRTQPSRWPSSSPTPTRTPPRGPSPFRRTMQTLVAVTAVILLVGGFYALTQRHLLGTGGQPTATTTNTATNTAQATATSTATATATSAAQLAACGFPTSQPSFAYDLGNGLIVRTDTAQTYPAFQLPPGEPLAPFKLAGDPSTSGQFLPALVNPDLRNGGLSFIACNIGQQPITIQGVKVSITSFTAYSGQLNSWNPCDGMYSGPNRITSGCGGGSDNNEIVQATFAANSGAGTVVDAVQKAAPPTAPGAYGPLPFELPVRRANSDATGVALIKVQVIPPTTPGIYNFGLGLVAQNREVAFVPAVSATTPMLLAPVAHKWSGQACEASNMSSQIPAETNPPTYYICPES
ncbi:MAG TPA: hypothetical protein VF510_04075 [Ktedonobacterales bacterium]